MNRILFRSLGWIFLSVVLCSSSAPAQPNPASAQLEAYVAERMAEFTRLWQQKEIAPAVEILEEVAARPGVDRIDDSWTTILYNLACGHALLGHADKALDYLEQAVLSGYSNAAHLQTDPDLEQIRGEPRFAEILGRARQLAAFWDVPVFATPFEQDLTEDEKVAGLSRVWSEVKYNFAFVDILYRVQWDSLYMAYLPLVRHTETTLEYYRLLTRLMAELRDGHSGIYAPRDLWPFLYAQPAIRTTLVEGRVIVTDVLADSLRKKGIVPGLEIVKVNGIPVVEFAEREVLPFQSASTPQDLGVRVFEYGLLAGPAGTPVELEFVNSKGKSSTYTLTRLFDNGLQPMKPLVEFKLLPGNTGYLALNSFDDERAVSVFDSLFPQIAKTDALIIDVRNNGGGNSAIGWSILGYLTDKPFFSSQWRTRNYRPAIRAWSRPQGWYGDSARELMPQGDKYYGKPVVMLTGPKTYSAAEDFCVAYDAMERGAIIGEPTGGSTGQPLNFSLPGGGGGRICTKHDRYPDGREFVRVGVIPDQVVMPSVADWRAGRDPVVDAAQRYLKQLSSK